VAAIRVGIIGCGQIAQTHLVQYAKMSGEDVKVVAVADISDACARTMRQP